MTATLDTATTIEFGDGEYHFFLALPQAMELERQCGKSLFTIYDQIGEGFAKDSNDKLAFIGGGSSMAKDINETIRLGLIGGNHGVVAGEPVEVGPVRAKQLVELYGFPARPMSEVAASAWHVLHAAIVGIELKKKAEVAHSAPKTRRSAKAKSS